MPKIAYQEVSLRQSSLAVIHKANRIISEYAGMGFRLTLRQLYYQFVSRDWIENSQKEYKRLGSIVSDGRLCGLIDWDAIDDRGRNLLRFSTWDSPSEIVSACAQQFKFDLWRSQENYVEAWIEKEALIDVVAQPCGEFRVPHFACKGYTSQSAIWSAGHHRLRGKLREGKSITILHLGDHDPSGIDMTRDIQERLSLFTGAPVEVIRLALNMDQVERYNPPPNPAKATDSRFADYESKFGPESWELDALNPEIMAEIIRKEIEQRIDLEQWKDDKAREDAARADLLRVADNFDDVTSILAGMEEDRFIATDQAEIPPTTSAKKKRARKEK